MYVCPIPGVDTATLLWHTGVHYGLAALVVTVGAIFLALALRAYRTSDPSFLRPDALARPPRVIRARRPMG
jgi:hypothetical protein